MDRLLHILAQNINSIEDKEIREQLEKSIQKEGVQSIEIVMRQQMSDPVYSQMNQQIVN